MKFEQIISFIIILFTFFTSIHAQDIQLKSGNKTKTIKAGTFIEIELPTQNQEPCSKCKYNRMTGQLISYAENKVTLKVIESVEPLVEEKENVGFVEKTYTAEGKGRTLSIPKDIILSIRQKGIKKLRDYKVGYGIGQFLLGIGLSQVLAAGINELDEGPQGNLLWISGGAEVVTGIVLLSAFGQKLYITHEECPQRQAGQSIWEIN